MIHEHGHVVAHLLSLGADPNGDGVTSSAARSIMPGRVLQLLIDAGGRVNGAAEGDDSPPNHTPRRPAVAAAAVIG